MLNSQNCVVLYSPFSCQLVSHHKHCRTTTGNLRSSQFRNELYIDTTSSSMLVNHTGVRMARKKIRGGLNLVYNLYEMDGWETKSDFSINRWQSLDPFLLATSHGCPVELPSRHVEAVHIST